MDPSLTPFFHPQGIAIIGASRDPTKLGYGLARNLVDSGFPGPIYFVNPRGDRLLGKPIFASVKMVPDPVDLAILMAPAPAVPAALQECGERGIAAVVLLSGGFREVGPAGAALEEECLRIAAQYHIRLVGPNCVGMIDTHLPLNGTFLPPPPPAPGTIAFLSHSGAICSAINDWLRGQGLGLSYLVSLGNQADITETDLLEPIANDQNTAVICLYIESIRDGARFIEQARLAGQKKPLLALKVGRFEAGRRAAASHTGALAGSEAAYHAAFRKAGVIRADATEEMFQWARALAWSPLPRGRRVAILTNAGGPGVTAADALEANGLSLAALSAETTAAMQNILPAAASLRNPVDMLASASPDHYAQCLQILLADPTVDSVLVILPAPPMYSAGAVAKATIPVIQSTTKPVVVAVMGDRLVQEAIEHFRAARVPEYRFPEMAASALAVLVQRAESLPKTCEDALPRAMVDTARAQELLSGQPAGHFLPQPVVIGLLEAYGIPTAQTRLAVTEDEARQAANAVGCPVVLKIASPDIPHKSDVGGVLLNLLTPDAASAGFRSMVERVGREHPQAKIDGCTVQRQIPTGQDVIAGVVQDPQFGPLVMFGSGGVEVEGLKDVAFALAPLTASESAYLLDSTWAGKKLNGFRHLPRADRAAVLDALARIGQLAGDFPQIAEIEINPLRVFAGEQGCIALDVRARLK
jgi:acetyltransferase